MNTNQVTPSTNQVDANNPQNPTAPVPAPSPVQTQAPSAQNPPTVVPSAQPNQAQTNPSASSAQPQQQAPQPSLHARIFDKILRGMTGGPVRSLYRDADLDGYHGDIGQLEFSVTEEVGEILASRFWEIDMTLAVGTNCFCAGCETENRPVTMATRSGEIDVREALQRLGLL